MLLTVELTEEQAAKMEEHRRATNAADIGVVLHAALEKYLGEPPATAPAQHEGPAHVVSAAPPPPAAHAHGIGDEAADPASHG